MSPRLLSVLCLALPLLGGCSPDRKPCKIVFPEGFEGAVAIVWDARSAPALPTEGAMWLIEVPPGGVVETSSPLSTGKIKDELYWRKGTSLAPIPEEKRADRTTGAHRSCGSVEEIFIGDKARLATMKSDIEARLEEMCGGPDSPAAAKWVMPEVNPGVGIGQVRLGMTRAELDKIGLPINDGPMLQVGSYRVILEADHVTFIEVSLASFPQGVRVGGELIAPTEKDLALMVKPYIGCTRSEVKPDISQFSCADGTMHVTSTGPAAVVMIDVTTKERAARAAAAPK
jgi:hypothetical protein